MRICVVTPYADYERRAGARIRYGRIRAPLQRLGADLVLRPLASFADIERLDDDVYLLSKCYSPAALVIAQAARDAGRKVGVDLFDDYVSQVCDTRLSHFRGWLTAAAQLADFVLCSTPAMADVARLYAPQLPVHVLNDPFDSFDAAGLEARLAAKSARLRSSGLLQIAWFGLGGNPYFPVGLRDLAAFGDTLAELQGRGLDVRLRILTNRGAASADVMAGLRRLPLAFTLHEWGEAEERALLEESYAAFLPVNAQPFSVAKSLNRAVTSLCAGAQVLSAGYPLYEPLAPFVYRDARELADDAVAGTARLNAGRLGDLAALLEEHADPEREARRLVEQLTALPPRGRDASTGESGDGRPSAALVQRRDATALDHDLARRYGVLSVGTPLSPPFDYDVKFQPNAAGTGLDLLVHRRVAALVEPAVGRLVRADSRDYLSADPGTADVALGTALAGLPMLPAYAAADRLLMSRMVALLERLLPGVPLILAEEGVSHSPAPPSCGAA